MTYSDVHTALKNKGTEIGHYHQGTRISNSRALSNAVSNGFCAGASLAWVRRVLLGGSAKEGPEDSHSAVAFLAQKASARDEFYNNRKTALNSAFNNVTKQTNTDLSALNTKAQVILNERLPKLSAQEQNDLIDKVQESLNKQSNAIKARGQEKMDQINSALKTDSLYDQFWKEFAKVVDQRLRTSDYSSLTVVRSSCDRRYGPENGLQKFLGEVLTGKSLAPGNAGVVGITPPTTGATGHAVGVQRVDLQLYYFFDPNFGTYAVDARTLLWMFLFLFLKAYP
ncbi:MAG TPA: hypothetical protein VFA15_08685, partial [Nitrososphaera sp.]|nr:hypothetical protein [Nitrososphaera sp.]